MNIKTIIVPSRVKKITWFFFNYNYFKLNNCNYCKLYFQLQFYIENFQHIANEQAHSLGLFVQMICANCTFFFLQCSTPILSK